jgi:hypothetical protein
MISGGSSLQQRERQSLYLGVTRLEPGNENKEPGNENIPNIYAKPN